MPDINFTVNLKGVYSGITLWVLLLFFSGILYIGYNFFFFMVVYLPVHSFHETHYC